MCAFPDDERLRQDVPSSDGEEADAMKRRSRAVVGAVVLVGLALVAASCGGDDEASNGATAPTAAGGTGTEGGGAGGTVAVTMGSPTEYALVPKPGETAAGAITFTVANEGTIEHEMVVIKTDKGAANLGTDDGEADEAGAVDEITLAAGDSGDLQVDLAPGAYALVCNLPGHYAAGMYADFTVK
jgi:uncharacterized cupredoxin-like copper-binding protein